MKQIVNQILIILLLVSSVSVAVTSNAYAELIQNPDKFVNNLVQRTKHSIGSISRPHGIDNSILSIVRGTVALVAPKNPGSLRSIFTGDGNKVKHRKIIKVKGSARSTPITLDGIGREGKGYIFDFPTILRTDTEDKKVTQFSDKKIGQLSIRFVSDSINSPKAGLDIDHVTAKRTNKALIVKGTFSEKINKGKARGRFTLRFTEK